jgi:Cu2+-containing amine oxidase
MSTTFEASLPIRAVKQSTTHPLAPIDATEIKQAVSYVRSQWPANTDLHFKCITLQEPAKKEVVPYLEAEASGAAPPQIDRRVLITYYIRKTVSYYKSPRFTSALISWLEQIPRSCCQPDHRNIGVQCSSWPELACSR